MSLFIPKTEVDNDLAKVGITLLECDICGKRFSSSMKWVHPFCVANIPHEDMSADEQIRRQKLLSETPEKATASFIMPALKFCSPRQLKVSWEDNKLPDNIERDEIILPREKLELFNNHYKIMGTFIGDLLGKHNWCIADILDYAEIAWKKIFKESES